MKKYKQQEFKATKNTKIVRDNLHGDRLFQDLNPATGSVAEHNRYNPFQKTTYSHRFFGGWKFFVSYYSFW